MTQTLPLLATSDLRATFAWRSGASISVGRFLADVAMQAERLPAHGQMINLCADRYAFTVAFAAALVRGHTSLLPPDALPETLARLQHTGSAAGSSEAMSPVTYGVTDAPSLESPGLLLLQSIVSSADPVAPVTAAPPTPMPQVAGDHLAAVLLTSGSTGAPTPHAKTFDALRRNVSNAASRLARLLDLPSIVGLNIVATVPPQHSYGFESSVLLALLSGASIDSGRPYFPADVAAALASMPRPRALVTTPFHLKALLAANVELPATDLVLSATAPLSPQLAQQAERRLGARLIEIYGCTEAGQVATRRPVESPTWETFDGLEIRQRPPSPADLQGATAGERSALMRYFVEGGHVLEPTPLGDILDLDDSRHFRLLGRSNDLIHVAGRRSSLAHLDHHLNSIAGIEDGAFWLPPDIADGVVRPVAFVVAPGLDSLAIIMALRARLETVFVPRKIVFVESLPREGTGKLTRHSLADLAVKHGLVAAPSAQGPAGPQEAT